MSHVAYHKDTTKFLRRHPNTKVTKELFGSAGAARAAITRAAKLGSIKAEDFLVATYSDFASIEKTHEVRNIMSGKMVTESVNTPYGCSVGDEAYWSN